MNKKRILEGIAISLASLIIMSFINLLTGYLTRSSGKISNGPEISMNTIDYHSIKISNTSDHTINGLRISVPKNFNKDSIKTNSALKFTEEQNSNSSNKKLSISRIEPNSNYLLLLPKLLKTSFTFKVLNNEECNLSLEGFNNIKNPNWRIFKNVSFNALLYAIFIFTIFMFISNKIDKAKADLKDSRKLTDKLSEQAKENKNALTRQKTLLLAKISDYSKELEFWRNTIKKILLTKFEQSEEDVENLISDISETLETQRTLAKQEFDFDQLKVITKLLNKEGN